MGLIIQQKALQAAGGLRQVLRLGQGGASRSPTRGGLRIRAQLASQCAGHRAR